MVESSLLQYLMQGNGSIRDGTAENPEGKEATQTSKSRKPTCPQPDGKWGKEVILNTRAPVGAASSDVETPG